MAIEMMGLCIEIDEEGVVQALREAAEKLNSVEGEVTLDFSSAPRTDPSAIRALQEFADIADDRGVTVVLRGVNIGVYKVLKLVKLAGRFSFVS